VKNNFPVGSTSVVGTDVQTRNMFCGMRVSVPMLQKYVTWPWPRPLLGSFIIHCILTTSSNRSNRENTRSQASVFIWLHVFNYWFHGFYSQVILHLIFGWELPISAVNFVVLGAKIGEGIFGFRPQRNQFFRFRPQRFLPNFVKIGWKMRP